MLQGSIVTAVGSGPIGRELTGSTSLDGVRVEPPTYSPKLTTSADPSSKPAYERSGPDVTNGISAM